MPQVLVAVPGEKVKIEAIDDGMNALRERIGGSLECVQLDNDFVLYCNHDGNQLDLAVNPHFSQGIIKGPFVITKTERQGKNIGIDQNEIEFIMKTFVRSE